MPTRPPTMMVPLPPSTTPYSLDLLTEYAHTLDSLPLDLSRIFADLRELDAVLTSTVSSVTAKIYQLIELIENRSVSNEQRLWLLGEIAEEASKVRPGADDKIRIATQAADNLHFQSAHLTLIAQSLPEIEPSMLVRRTRYPHVSLRAYTGAPSFETGRRRRAPGGGGGWLGTGDGSPNKKRRVIQEEELDYGVGGKSPRKEKTGGDGSTQPRPPRGGPRPKKTDRNPSPSESLLSVASPMPGHGQAVPQRNTGTTSNRNAHGSSSSKRRTNVHNQGEGGSLLDTVISRKEAAHHNHLPPSSSTTHPSLIDADHVHEINGTGRGKSGHGHGHGADAGAHQLEGPGVPGARASTHSSLTNIGTMDGSPAPGGAAATPGTTGGDGGDGDGDAENDDGKTYCFCENVSYGEMIGCDGPTCTREWFHLACIGLTVPPKGVWYCEECVAKRNKQKNGRGGKKRAGGGGGSGGRTGAKGNGA